MCNHPQCDSNVGKKPIEIPVVSEDAVVPQTGVKVEHCGDPTCGINHIHFSVKDSGKREEKVYGTTVDVKRENFDKFAKLISSQFNHGGDKYKLQGFEDREATDVISSVFGGPSEFDWVLGTMMKYLFRFKNFHREKDLLKIATYCYILWLKQGNHLKENHDEDTSK